MNWTRKQAQTEQAATESKNRKRATRREREAQARRIRSSREG